MVKSKEQEVEGTMFRVTTLRITAEHRANSMVGDSIDRRYVECTGDVQGIVFSVEPEEDALIALEALVKNVSGVLGVALEGEVIQPVKSKVRVV